MFLVNVLVNLFADSIFSLSIHPAFHTWFLQGLCIQVMSCSFQLVPNFRRQVVFLYLFFHKFLFIFHNSKTIQGIWMDLNRNVDPDDQALCTQVT